MSDLMQPLSTLVSMDCSLNSWKAAPQERWFQCLVENFPDILYRYHLQDPRGFDYINAQIYETTGHFPADYIQKPELIFDPIHPEDRHFFEKNLAQGCEQAPFLMRWYTKDGKMIWMEHRSHVIKDDAGNPVAIEGSLRDFTLQKQQIEEEINSKLSVVTQLVSVSKALDKPTNLYELAEVIGTGALHICNATSGLLFQVAADKKTHHLWSQGLMDLDQKTVIEQIYQAIQNTPLTHKDGQTTQTQRPVEAAKGFRSMLVCPMIYDRTIIGGLVCLSPKYRAWSKQEVAAVEAFARQATVALENIQLNLDLQESYLQAVLALTKTMNVRDTYTSEHSHQLVGWAEALAWKLGCHSREIESIRWAALLHDIGKIGIPDTVLRKPSKLNDEEWKIMKRHSQIGADIVGVIQQMDSVSCLIKYHHEHFDGSGYPEGLRGEQIPLGARILAVVDAYSAMTANRVYQPARPPKEACEELKHSAGTQFDPKVVNMFLKILPSVNALNPLPVNA